MANGSWNGYILFHTERAGNSQRSKLMEEFSKTILESSKLNLASFDDFSERIVAFLRSVCTEQSSSISRSHAVFREKCWKAFFQKTTTVTPGIWKELFESLEISTDDHLLEQSVTWDLFGEIIKGFLTAKSPSQEPVADALEVTFSRGENYKNTNKRMTQKSVGLRKSLNTM